MKDSVEVEGTEKGEGEGSLEEPTLLDRAKSLVGEGKSRAIAFYNDHERAIKGVAGFVATAAAVIVIGKGARENGQLRDECARLAEDLEVEREVSDRLSDRVVELEDLCAEKDEWTAALASDALRSGSSLGGKVMADRRDFLSGRY